MKRSRINEILVEADDMMRRFGFVLPPFAYWSPEEFAASLHNLAEGRIDGSKLVSGHVGLDGVPQAFKDLADPEKHVKILVRPNL